ncbi:MAG: hypothetical protein ABIJ81_01040 [Patescibacteria group bacterium]
MWFYLAPYFLAAASALPFILGWRFPQFIPWAGWYLFLVAAIILWLWWEPRRLAQTLWPWFLLLFFWLSSLVFFLFLNQDVLRGLMIVVVPLVTWWYITGWLANRSKSLQLVRGPGTVVSAAMAWLIFFFSGVAAVSWLVFLNINFWLLFLIYFAVSLLTLLSVGWIAGWTIKNEWYFLLAAFVIQLEAFIVLSWWPISFYMIGWLEASVFLALFLLTRYDTSVVMTRRTLFNYLSLLIIISLILIGTSRWF